MLAFTPGSKLAVTTFPRQCCIHANHDCAICQGHLDSESPRIRVQLVSYICMERCNGVFPSQVPETLSDGRLDAYGAAYIAARAFQHRYRSPAEPQCGFRPPGVARIPIQVIMWPQSQCVFTASPQPQIRMS